MLIVEGTYTNESGTYPFKINYYYYYLMGQYLMGKHRIAK
jgi:hypothetical protein